jgi:integrase
VPKHEGVYRDAKGWYFKARVSQDILTGKWTQATRRGFASAVDASTARRELLEGNQAVVVGSGSMSVNELMKLYFEDAESSSALSTKTLFDYRNYADVYVSPYLGGRAIRDITPEMIARWQQKLTKGGAIRSGKPLSSNSVRLARAPLAGAFKYAIRLGHIRKSPMENVPRPKQRRSIARHWSPEQAREFLMWQDEDRLYPLWAFLLGSGLRIGELVWLEWKDVDFERGLVRIVSFASTLGYELVASSGKSRDAVRTVELDPYLIAVLERQRKVQATEGEARCDTKFVFTKVDGDTYHPQWLSRRLGLLSVEAKLPRLTAHGLRHTSATLMLASGVPAKVAAERLGHSDPTLFTNLYSHVTPTMQTEAANRIGVALFGSV